MKYTKDQIIKGTVSGIENYGIFLKIDDIYTGLIHISEVSNGFVRNINDFVKVDDVINVKILDVDENEHKIKLSIKNINYRIRKKNYREIIETKSGFSSLERYLPVWIEKNIKNHKKNLNSIDK